MTGGLLRCEVTNGAGPGFPALFGPLLFRLVSFRRAAARKTVLLRFDYGLGSELVLCYYVLEEGARMYFMIEYVDTLTGIGGEALAWEFAKSEDEATIKARGHFLLFKARFGAQGYRILSPSGSLIACGPGAAEYRAPQSPAIKTPL